MLNALNALNAKMCFSQELYKHARQSCTAIELLVWLQTKITIVVRLKHLQDNLWRQMMFEIDF